MIRTRYVCFSNNTFQTRMHSSRMRTARSLIVSPYFVVSHAHPPQEQPRTHLPAATMHAPLEQPCTPPRAATHAPPAATTHALPGATTHAPPGATMHTPPEQPRMPPPCGQTDTCKNITFANFVCGR